MTNAQTTIPSTTAVSDNNAHAGLTALKAEASRRK